MLHLFGLMCLLRGTSYAEGDDPDVLPLVIARTLFAVPVYRYGKVLSVEGPQIK